MSKAVAVLLLLLLVRTVLLATSSRLGLRGLWLWQVGLLSFLQLHSRWWCLVTLLQLLVCSMLPLCRWQGRLLWPFGANLTAMLWNSGLLLHLLLRILLRLPNECRSLCWLLLLLSWGW